MSWQIPTQIEQDIIAGKATYRTFQTGNGGQSILPVPAKLCGHLWLRFLALLVVVLKFYGQTQQASNGRIPKCIPL
jgi:hypothetical protein